MSSILPHMMWLGANLECRSRWNIGRKNYAINRHLRTIAQSCRAISLQLRHLATIGKTIQQQYLLHMSSQCGELEFQPSNGWDRLMSIWGTPANFNGFRVLASLFSRFDQQQSTEHHVHSAGWPSRWASAHILVSYIFCSLFFTCRPTV